MHFSQPYKFLFFKHDMDDNMPSGVKKDKPDVNRRKGHGQYDGFVFAIEIFITIVLLILIYFLSR
ncbi:MAG: hypothetical protein EOO93_30860 [Pedobacter sp.]|nr:MAG: hypothetical protein EOO93_30860 [Pedobacter sp.]